MCAEEEKEFNHLVCKICLPGEAIGVVIFDLSVVEDGHVNVQRRGRRKREETIIVDHAASQDNMAASQVGEGSERLLLDVMEDTLYLLLLLIQSSFISPAASPSASLTSPSIDDDKQTSTSSHVQGVITIAAQRGL